MLDLSTIPNYTDAQLLAAFRYGLLQLAISEEVSIAGRTLRRSQLPEIRQTIQWLETRIADLGGGVGGQIALAEFSQPDIGVRQNPGTP